MCPWSRGLENVKIPNYSTQGPRRTGVLTEGPDIGDPWTCYVEKQQNVILLIDGIFDLKDMFPQLRRMVICWEIASASTNHNWMTEAKSARNLEKEYRVVQMNWILWQIPYALIIMKWVIIRKSAKYLELQPSTLIWLRERWTYQNLTTEGKKGCSGNYR